MQQFCSEAILELYNQSRKGCWDMSKRRIKLSTATPSPVNRKRRKMADQGVEGIDLYADVEDFGQVCFFFSLYLYCNINIQMSEFYNKLTNLHIGALMTV